MQQFTYRLDMVGPEVVHYHDVPWSESRNQNIFQISRKFVSCCSALKDCKSYFSIQSNRRQNGCGFRRVQRRVIYHTLAAFSPAISSSHVDIHTAFIQENQMGCLRFLRKPTPLFSLGLHIGDASVLKRESSSFFADTPLSELLAARFLFQPSTPIFL